MKQLLGRINHQLLGFVGIGALLLGFLFSRALLSIGMILLVFNVLVNLRVGEHFRRFLRTGPLLGLTLIALVYWLSGLYSSDTDWLMGRLRINLPFLLLPFAMVAIPRFDRSVYFPLLSIFFLLVSATAFYTLVGYLGNYQETTEAYQAGKVMETPINHIRYSLLLVYCSVIGWYLFQKGYYWRFAWERYVLLGLSIFLVVFVHLLAVRSGLLALYGVVIFLLGRYIVQSRRYWLGLTWVLLLSVGGYFAIRFVPSLNNKLNYTIYSIDLFLEKRNLRGLSDSNRLASIEAGLAVGRENFWIGVGIGDIQQATERYLEEHYPSLTGLRLMPHNQYVQVFAATGIIGLLVFSGATIYPLFYRRAWRDILIVAFHIIAILSFIVEHTLETQIGLAFYLVFVLLNIRYWMDETATAVPE